MNDPATYKDLLDEVRDNVRICEGRISAAGVHARLRTFAAHIGDVMEVLDRLVESGAVIRHQEQGQRAFYEWANNPSPAKIVIPAAKAQPAVASTPTPKSAAPAAAYKRVPLKPKGEMREAIFESVRAGLSLCEDIAKAQGLKSSSSVYYHLNALRAAGRISNHGKQWSVPVHPDGQIPAPRKGQKLPKAASCTVTDALASLESRLHAVERLDTKVQVLDRLCGLLDPTIAAVLSEIRLDLTRSATA